MSYLLGGLYEILFGGSSPEVVAHKVPNHPKSSWLGSGSLPMTDQSSYDIDIFFTLIWYLHMTTLNLYIYIHTLTKLHYNGTINERTNLYTQ
jgi:hypothetical protein